MRVLDPGAAFDMRHQSDDHAAHRTAADAILLNETVTAAGLKMSPSTRLVSSLDSVKGTGCVFFGHVVSPDAL